MSVRTSLTKRHPAEVTADRLRDHLERDWDSANENRLLDEISHIIDWLEEVAGEADRE